MGWRYRQLPEQTQDSLLAHLAVDTSAVHYALIDVSHLSDEQIERVDANRWGIATNLYADLAGTAIMAMGPRLLQITPENIPEMVGMAFETRALSFMSGACDQATLVGHLQSIREVELPAHTAVLFRFQDIHVTSALFPVLKVNDAGQCLGPLDSWSVLDSCSTLHIIEATGKTRASGRIRFDEKTVKILDDSLLIHAARAQINDVDTTLLAAMSDCEAEILIRQRIELARTLGLERHDDLALFCVLSLQFPDGFQHRPPFAEALRYREKNKLSFGDALDDVPSEAWVHWDELLQDEE